MAGKPPTCQQLAYLDELKERLRELRKRQVTFMEETAEILRTIGPDRVRVPKKTASSEQLSIESVEESEQSPVEDGESVGNIKQLIRRFEDLRQTSRQFNDQTMPQELAGVDVRRLLNGYENLIVEGNMLQKNWMQLKKTSESCARQNNNKYESKLLYKPGSTSSPSFAELSLWGNDNDNDRPEGRTGQVKSLKISIESKRVESKSKSGQRDVGKDNA